MTAELILFDISVEINPAILGKIMKDAIFAKFYVISCVFLTKQEYEFHEILLQYKT